MEKLSDFINAAKREHPIKIAKTEEEDDSNWVVNLRPIEQQPFTLEEIQDIVEICGETHPDIALMCRCAFELKASSAEIWILKPQGIVAPSDDSPPYFKMFPISRSGFVSGV